MQGLPPSEPTRRTCQVCGKPIIGGSARRFCPACNIERQQEAQRKRRRLRRARSVAIYQEREAARRAAAEDSGEPRTEQAFWTDASTPGGLRARRRQLGLSQAALAALLGVASTTVRRWESGACRPRALARRRLEVLLTPTVRRAGGRLDQWFNGRQAARHLRISHQAIYQAIQRGSLRSRRIGRSHLVREQDLVAWRERGRESRGNRIPEAGY
jgi:excisionase family DNA binding protein